jgi:putative nucleotidyltransferase with HDIG domain
MKNIIGHSRPIVMLESSITKDTKEQEEMTRDEALTLIRANIKTENTIKHMLATEAIMRSLAVRFGEDHEEWGMAGLLHDIDLEQINNDMSAHSKVGAEIVKQHGVSPAITHAILTHNEHHGIARESMMDKALFCVDPLTGLITAVALVRPEKKLAAVEARSVRKRFKEKSFAAGANREIMAQCTEIGLDLDTFIAVGLEAMQRVAGDLVL